MTIKEIKEDELESFIDKKCSILLGNGLGLSHPNDNIKSFFKFKDEDIKNQVKEDFTHRFLLQKFTCPEEMMDYFRTEFALAILHNYVHDFKNVSTIPYQDRLHQYLSKFGNIYTLNYDPIIYRALMSNKKEFTDGFYYYGLSDVPSDDDGVKFSFKNIYSTLKNEHNKQKLLFLHGAFHLFFNYNDKNYYKLKQYQNGDSPVTSLVANCEEMYEKILRAYRQKKSSEWSPLIVLAPRSTYKGAIIEEIEYLKFCSEQLSGEDKVFVFGCSFKNDYHIMSKLLESEKKKNLIITYYTDEDKKIITEHIQLILKKKSVEHDIKLLKAENSYFCEKIWGTFLS